MERSSLLRSLHMHQSTVISDGWQNAPPPQIRQIHKYDKYGNITQNVVVVECITVRWLVPNETAWWQEAYVCKQLAQGCYLKVQGHSVATSSAECNHCSPPFSLFCAQLLTMCDIVCIHKGTYQLLQGPTSFFSLITQNNTPSHVGLSGRDFWDVVVAPSRHLDTGEIAQRKQCHNSLRRYSMTKNGEI